MKKIWLPLGFVLLFAVEILHIYFIMPFPGSQQSNTISIAYFLDRNIWWIRILLLLLIAIPFFKIFVQKKLWKKILTGAIAVLYAAVFYFFNFQFKADKMFYQPQHKNLAAAANNKVPLDKLVLGVSLHDEATAYPLEIIGYHHQVQDTIGGEPVMITYCTVCRTGRAFSPFVNGKKESFRLVGMDHFNAMFEDNTTKSWWRQATGEAITGKLKGTVLAEIPSQQMSLAAWLQQYPASKILQPDETFTIKYDSLAGFDNGTIKSSLEKRDSSSWQFKSWVVGIAIKGESKAYDWNDIAAGKIIEDSMAGVPLMITIEKDAASFHVFSRSIDNMTLHFSLNDAYQLTDAETASLWNQYGVCIEGIMKGKHLMPLQASQEFWHSWQTFHPLTKKYEH